MTRALVVLLAATLIVPPASIAADSGAIEGRVVAPKGTAAPQAVWVASASQPQAPLRSAIQENGAFRLEALPAGAVELAVETAEGLYVVETPVTIAPGATRQVQLALRGGKQEAPEQPKESKKKTGGIWDNPLTATLIVVGGAVVTGLIVDALDDDNESSTASPSNP